MLLAAILLAPSAAQDVAAAASDVPAPVAVMAAENEGVTMYGYHFDHFHDSQLNLTTDCKDILVGVGSVRQTSRTLRAVSRTCLPSVSNCNVPMVRLLAMAAVPLASVGVLVHVPCSSLCNHVVSELVPVCCMTSGNHTSCNV
jgi:hypothetical protein